MARMTKKKVNPTSKCHTKKRRKRIRRNTRKAYSETAIKEALAAIRAGDTLRKASKAHNVPVTTLFRRSKDPNSVAKKSGPPTVLSAEVEQRIVDWIIYRGKRGHPVGKSNIIEGVELYIKEAGIDCKSFVNGKPGRHSYEAFMRRHPELSKRTPQHLTKARYEVDEEDLRQWFHEVKTHLESKNLLNIHPSRIFNCDETNLALCPKSKYVITAKGAKNSI
ncbi:uncharacterized protein [Chelonus insularis]|uniref:uncharacterized protein n=1 Tax=Chelonus insularis TaxID=460826 RepID=UPI0015893FBC|nr:uncharacterized protein LOC118064423 [Chelonus insularis]